MTSVNLEKTLEYLKIQESLQSENFTQSTIHVKKYFYIFFSTLKYIIEAQSKTNHLIS